MITRPCFLLVPLLLAAPMLHAQSTGESLSPLTATNQPEHESFLVTLNLKSSDHDKRTSDETYTMAVLTKEVASNVREGDRMPIVTSADGGKTEIQYIDLGTRIDVLNARRINGLVSIDIKVELSSVVPESSGKDDPIIRQRVYSINPAVPIGKQVVVYSSSDAVTGHKVEIQVLVQPIPAA